MLPRGGAADHFRDAEDTRRAAARARRPAWQLPPRAPEPGDLRERLAEGSSAGRSSRRAATMAQKRARSQSSMPSRSASVRNISVLSDPLRIPGIGFLPVNAFVLHASEPVVVDPGPGLPGRGSMQALGGVVDPADIRWIWLTHHGRHHAGARSTCSKQPSAPNWSPPSARWESCPPRTLPLNRVYLLNPSQCLDVDDRTLSAVR